MEGGNGGLVDDGGREGRGRWCCGVLGVISPSVGGG